MLLAVNCNAVYTLGGRIVKNLLSNAGDAEDTGSILRRKSQPTPVFLPGKSHGVSSLAGFHGVTRVVHD